MHAISYAQLNAAATALASAAGTSLAGLNQNPAGRWRGIAEAAEALAGTSPAAGANASQEGYLYRAVVALETMSGTTGAEENPTEMGLLKRLVDALEKFSEPGTGPLEHRLQIAAENAVFEITLNALTGTFTLAESAIAGAIAGTLSGMTDGSSLSLVDTAGNRVALDGNAIERGATSLDYETNTSHSFTVRETHPDAAAPGYRDTVLSLTVTNVLEVTLTDVTGTFAVTEDVSVGTVIGAIGNVNSGAALSLADDASGKVAISGTNLVVGANGVPTPGSYSFTIRQTHADASNSPKDTVFSLTVNSAAPSIVAVTNHSTPTSPTSWAAFSGVTVAVGELLVFVMNQYSSGPTLSTASSGWTKLIQQNNAGTPCALAIFYKVAASTSESLTIASTVGGQCAGRLFRIANAANITATSASNVSSTNPDPPNHNPGVSRAHLWLATVGAGGLSGTPSAGPSGYSDFTVVSTGPTGCHLGTAHRSTVASSENPGVFTNASSAGWSTITAGAYA